MSNDETGRDPQRADAALEQTVAKARTLAQAGDIDGAASMARALLDHSPDNAPAAHLLGMVLAQKGELEDAIALLERARGLDRHLNQVHLDLGNLYRRQGAFAASLTCYRAAVDADPLDMAVLRNLAFLLVDTAHDDDPQTAAPKFSEAVPLLTRIARNGDPVPVPVLQRLIEALLALNQPEDALVWLNRFPQTHENAVVLFLLGNARYAVGDFEGAVDAYGLAEAQNLNDPMLSCNHGNACKALGRQDEAIGKYEQALDMDPKLVGAWAGLGDSLETLRRNDDARHAYETALTLAPDYVEVDSSLLNLNLKTAQWDGLDRHITRIEKAVTDGKGLVSPFDFLTVTQSPKLQLACSTRWAAVHLNAVAPAFAHELERKPGPIRVGYLAAGYRRHPMAHLLSEVFELHDRDRFEVFGYSHGPDDGSAERRRMAAAMDVFRDVRPMTDRQIAQVIYDDGIDILIDRDGYTEGARTKIAALRPAPVQVSYLVFAATMGVDFIDYSLLDPWVAPMDEQPFFRERIVHLPHCYQPNDRKRPVSAHTPSKEQCGLPEDGFVYCCFNGTQKIRPDVFELWMKILAQVPRSVLWLLGDNQRAIKNLSAAAQSRGIDPHRLVFAERRPIDDHLARYRLADLFLDTLPYNAHTTASDALWMGCPVLTRSGSTFPGRVAHSILRAIELPELVTHFADDYVASAVRYGTSPLDIDALRDKLAANRLRAPLFDTPRYTRHLERAFETMHHRRMTGLAPVAFAIQPDGGTL